MKLRQFFALDWIWASLLTLFIFLAGFYQNQQASNNYYQVTVENIKTHGTIFLTDYPAYFNELVPTARGPVMVLPPFPLLPTYIGSLLKLGELEMTRLGVGMSVALMYLIMREHKQTKLRARLGAFLFFVTTPMFFFFVERGYWLSAQTWGVVGAQLAYLFLLKKHLGLAGLGTAMAILARINLGVLTFFFFAIYVGKTYRLKGVVSYFVPVAVGICLLLAWNYLRFGSIWETGYNLIPGVLEEPWYHSGVMHPGYIWQNFQDYIGQVGMRGTGIGIIWMQPYLLLLPWVVNKQNWWMILLGFAQFLVVLAHGEKGGYQLEFRYLMDALWIWVPWLLLEKRGWREVAILACFLVSAVFHLIYI